MAIPQINRVYLRLVPRERDNHPLHPRLQTNICEAVSRFRGPAESYR